MKEFMKTLEEAWIALLSGFGSFSLMALIVLTTLYWFGAWGISCKARACLLWVN